LASTGHSRPMTRIASPSSIRKREMSITKT
jgi:hypothetical protein